MEKISNNTTRILIVDDEESMLFAFRRLSEKLCITVDTCGCFDEALEMLKANDYSAVITDLRLSDSKNWEGLDILRYIREHQTGTLVILMTGYGSDELKEYILEQEMTYYIEKPIIFSAICGILKEAGLIADEI